MTVLPDFRRLSWQRPGLTAAARRAGLMMLSSVELTRVGSETGSDRFLQGRMLLRTLAGTLLSIDPAKVPLSATCPDCGGPHGQPRITGVAVSLSHCATAVVAVATLLGSVGVDVEPLEGSAARDAAIAAVAGEGGRISDGGAGGIGGGGGIRGIRRWTSVEAVLKADGRGLRVDPSEVSVNGSSAGLGDERYALWHPELDVALHTTVAWRP